MKRLAIIPARGGSKRLPRKNVLPFMGKPMFLWSCDAARESGVFDEIIVSTDDPQVAEIAKEHGYDVDDRPAHLGSDTASVADVCLEFLQRKEKAGITFDSFCVLYATAPMRTAEDIVNVVSLLDSDDGEYAHAMTSYGLPPHQMMYENKDGYYAHAWPLIAPMKTQELPELVVDNGSTYAVKTSAFMRTRKLFGSKLKGYRMPRMRSVDIDTKEDFDVAQLYAKHLLEND